MADPKTRIEELVQENLKKESLFLVDVTVSAGPKKKITISLDGDDGVSVEDCAELSRKLGEAIEMLNIIDTAYILEVTSAGIDAPLKFKRQYAKNVGRRLNVTLVGEGVKMGKLTEVKENSILMDEEIKDKNKAKGKMLTIVPIEIPFDQIKKSTVIIAFN